MSKIHHIYFVSCLSSGEMEVDLLIEKEVLADEDENQKATLEMFK